MPRTSSRTIQAGPGPGLTLLMFTFLPPQGATLHATPAAGRGLCPALPALPTPFFCLRVSALPNVPSVTMTTATESASVSVTPESHKCGALRRAGRPVRPTAGAITSLRSDLLPDLPAACDSQCLTCDTPGACTSCRDPTRVLLFGECQYDSCAHQYYLDATTRTCRGTPRGGGGVGVLGWVGVIMRKRGDRPSTLQVSPPLILRAPLIK